MSQRNNAVQSQYTDCQSRGKSLCVVGVALKGRIDMEFELVFAFNWIDVKNIAFTGKPVVAINKGGAWY